VFEIKEKFRMNRKEKWRKRHKEKSEMEREKKRERKNKERIDWGQRLEEMLQVVTRLKNWILITVAVP
jgi:hypothetical protein